MYSSPLGEQPLTIRLVKPLADHKPLKVECSEYEALLMEKEKKKKAISKARLFNSDA